jgi:hypothetical protein
MDANGHEKGLSTQRHRDAKQERTLCGFAPLRLCVENAAIMRGKILAKMCDLTDCRAKIAKKKTT